MLRTGWRDRGGRAPRTRALRMLAYALLMGIGWPALGDDPAEGPDSGEPEADDVEATGPAFRVEIDPISARVYGRVEFPVRVLTDEPVQVLGIRLQTDPRILRFRGWRLGDGLATHIAEHGEPPSCDVIIYPDGSGVFAVMALAVPFATEEYGEEWLSVEFDVSADSPKSTCLFEQHDSEDYEPGSVERLGRFISGAPRTCVPATVANAVRLRRGDVDLSRRVDLTDSIVILRYLFFGERAPRCGDTADVDDDGTVSLTDAVSILYSLFSPSEPVEWPCEPDETRDALPSCEFSSC